MHNTEKAIIYMTRVTIVEQKYSRYHYEQNDIHLQVSLVRKIKKTERNNTDRNQDLK